MTRIVHAWRALASEQRLAALAALALWVTLLLPWYHKNVTETIHGQLQAAGHDVSGWGAFSFVEAAVLLVSVGILAMLFARAERRAFHLPGGDGFVILLAGGWTTLLVFYRLLDTPSLSNKAGQIVTDVGPAWGIFIALAAAGSLAYAGLRVRGAHRPEPDLEHDPTRPLAARRASGDAGSDDAVIRRAPRARPGADAARGAAAGSARYPPRPGAAATRPTRVVTREDAEQLSFDVPEPPAEPDPFR